VYAIACYSNLITYVLSPVNVLPFVHVLSSVNANTATHCTLHTQHTLFGIPLQVSKPTSRFRCAHHGRRRPTAKCRGKRFHVAVAGFFHKHASHLVSTGESQVRRGKTRSLKWPKIFSPLRQTSTRPYGQLHRHYSTMHHHRGQKQRRPIHRHERCHLTVHNYKPKWSSYFDLHTLPPQEDIRPSQLMAKLISLMPPDAPINTDLFYSFFLFRMPQSIREALTATNYPNARALAAAAADRIWDLRQTSPPAVAAAAPTRTGPSLPVEAAATAAGTTTAAHHPAAAAAGRRCHTTTLRIMTTEFAGTVKWGNIVTFLTFNEFFLNNS
jgi:hypothetical protein